MISLFPKKQNVFSVSCSFKCYALSLPLYFKNLILLIMASRKNLKKVIGYISDELLSQAIYVSLNSDRDAEAWNELFARIICMNNDYVARVSHKQPGMAASAYFNALCASFNEEAKAIVAEIQKG